MGSKTISLRDEAYQRLKALKKEGESFSDVVMDLTDDGKGGFESLVGKGIDATFQDLKQMRERSEKDNEREELLRGH